MKLLAVILATLAISFCPSRAMPAAPTAAEILANARAAQGGAAWDQVKMLRAKGALSTGGLQGRFDSLEDVATGTYVDHFDLGVIRGANGFDGRSTWSQDASGVVRAEGAQEATTGAANEAYRRSRAFWFQDRWPGDVSIAGDRTEGGRRFYVLKIMPRDGRSFDLWVDADTWLFDRIIQQEGPELQTTFLSDYREPAGGPAGLKIAFSSRSTNGTEKYDTVAHTESIEVNPAVEATAFAPPPPPKPDSGFMGGVQAATLPFEFINRHIFVQVKLNGRGPYRFFCDTGGMNLVVPRVAQELGLASAGAIEGSGAGEAKEDVAVTKVQRVEVGPAYLDDQTFFVFPLDSADDIEGVRIDGLIGYELFRRFIVRVDYERQVLTLSAPAGWKYTGTAPPVPFVFNEHIPQIDGSIDGIAGKFDIDTGSRSSLDVMAPFVEAHDLVARYQPKFEAITGWGVGGPSRSRVARAGELRLGNVAVQGPIVELSLAKRGSFASPYVAGNVGAGVLRRFNVTFDYGAQRMYLEPNGNLGDADVYDRSGMWVNFAGNSKQAAFEVVEAVPGGPAAAAGIKAGDRIIRVNGRAPREVGLSDFRVMLKGKPGTRVELRIAAQGGDHTAIVVLKDLI